MAEHSARVMEHYLRPRNAGRLDSRDPTVGTGEAKDPDRGDVLRLQIRIDVMTGIIRDARFKAFGCVSTIAAGSLATERLIGQVADAVEPGQLGIAMELELPADHMRSDEMVEQAIRAALADWRQRNVEGGTVANDKER